MNNMMRFWGSFFTQPWGILNHPTHWQRQQFVPQVGTIALIISFVIVMAIVIADYRKFHQTQQKIKPNMTKSERKDIHEEYADNSRFEFFSLDHTMLYTIAILIVGFIFFGMVATVIMMFLMTVYPFILSVLKMITHNSWEANLIFVPILILIGSLIVSFKRYKPQWLRLLLVVLSLSSVLAILLMLMQF